MLQQLRKPRRDESGFTLIELLIVIVILGILAAIVVFAVNGIQDKGKTSACKADVATVTVAAEAYDAQHGRYAKSMEQLVSEGLLHSVPSEKNYTVEYRVADDGGSVDVFSDFCGGPSDQNPSSSAPSSSASAEEIAAYCDALAETLNNGIDINSMDDDGYNGLIKSLKRLAILGPNGIGNDWNVLIEALDSMHQILAEAGLTWRDQNALYNNELPGGLTQEESDALITRLQEPFNSDDVRVSIQDIGQTARDLCGGFGPKD